MTRYDSPFALIKIQKRFKGFEYRQVEVSEGVKDKMGYDSHQLKEVEVRFVLGEKIQGSNKASVVFNACEDKLGLVFDTVRFSRDVRKINEDVMELTKNLREEAEFLLEENDFDIVEGGDD